MHEEKPDEVDEMPEAGGAPCGDIFGTSGTEYVTDADDDDTPAPGAERGGPQ
jgi:hypothetical protein